jgi:serine/threonine protein kinase
MKVYCTRPRQEDEAPHLTEIPDENLNEPHQCATCGMPLILQGRYVPSSELGRGGFGYTFLALDLQFDTNRTIKQLRSDRFLSAAEKEQAKIAFDKECEILDQLNHQQIPRIYEHFEITTSANSESGILTNQLPIYYYFVQQYIEGEDLNRQLKQGKLFTEEEVRKILNQILSVLEYIHNLSIPIIHRDIKPSNIIHATNGTYYLIDFGAVKRILPEVTLGSSTRAETILVAPGFSPPEQYEGKINCSSDIYALGKTCLALLAGNSSQRKNKVSYRLAHILKKMTREDRSKRYQIVAELKQELNRPPHDWYEIVGAIIFISASLFIAKEVIDYYNENKVELKLSSTPTLPKIKTFKPTQHNEFKEVTESIDVPFGYFTYCCSKTWGFLPKKLKQSSVESFNYFNLNFKQPSSPEKLLNSETGVEMLIDGEIDIALTSKEIPPGLKLKAQKKNVTLMQTEIGKSSVVVVVNPALKINNINGENITKIENAEITNWKDLASSNHKINIYATDDKNFKLGTFQYTHDTKESLDKVANDRYGFAMVPINWVKNRCDVKVLSIDSVSPFKQGDNNLECSRDVDIEVMKRENNRYLKISTLRVVIRDDNNNLAGKAYITMLMSGDGQRIIREAGYLPITDQQ